MVQTAAPQASVPACTVAQRYRRCPDRAALGLNGHLLQPRTAACPGAGWPGWAHRAGLTACLCPALVSGPHWATCLQVLYRYQQPIIIIVTQRGRNGAVAQSQPPTASGCGQVMVVLERGLPRAGRERKQCTVRRGGRCEDEGVPRAAMAQPALRRGLLGGSAPTHLPPFRRLTS